jgi:hypothetical protein
MTDTMTERRQASHDAWGDIPEGYELVAVRDAGWRFEPGRRCRRMGPGYVSCGKPSVAAIRRGISRPQWWAYCADHLYGHWVEDGVVMHWILKPTPEPAPKEG